MGTTRNGLVGAAVAALLLGLYGAVAAQEDAAVADVPRAVSGVIGVGPSDFDYRYRPATEVDWDEERRLERRRGAFWSDPITMDDPRLTGALRYTWNRDTYGGQVRSGRGEVLTGRYELVNDGGSWVGTMRGYVTALPRHHFWQIELSGVDGYEGHTALLSAHGPAGGDWEVEGFVFPGTLPDYPVGLPAE